MDYHLFFKLGITLFIIMNPFAASAIYLATVKNASNKEKHIIVGRMSISILIILIVSVWFGDVVLDFFGISQSAFRIAGGLIILFFGLRILGTIPFVKEDKNISMKNNVLSQSIVPLAIPLVAGPGAIATTISEVHLYFHSVASRIGASIVVIIVVVILWIFFLYLPVIAKKAGDNVVDIISKIMGMVLAAIAIGMMIDGLIGAFPILGR